MEKNKLLAALAALLIAILLISNYAFNNDDMGQSTLKEAATPVEKTDRPGGDDVITPGETDYWSCDPTKAKFGPLGDKIMTTNLENTMYLDLSTGGRVVIEMYPDKAPNHVARFKELARECFYDGIVFHRVIEGFMAQTGDPTGTGSGGSGQNIKAEFNDIHHDRGVVSTARAMSPDSADSQFFIMLAPSPHLDGQYTAWGRVVEGMDYVDAITKGPRENNGVVPEDQRSSIETMRVAADVEGKD